MNESHRKPEKEFTNEALTDRDTIRREVNNGALNALEQNIERLANEHEKVRLHLL
jgi:hypothetical protein